MRFFTPARQPEAERLLWSRDIRFVHRLAATVAGGRLLELDSGTVFVAPVDVLTEAVAAEVARASHNPEYGLVGVDESLPAADRYVVALSSAVQLSGIADRIGMAQSAATIQTKALDYFFLLRNLHAVHFQPIVRLSTATAVEYECLFRPDMPQLPQSITSIVRAAIDTDRSVELDAFIVQTILVRAAVLQDERTRAGQPAVHLAINLTPASLLDPRFEAGRLAADVREHGLDPRHITLECTEQQAVSEIEPLKRQVKALRRLGFGFAIDDAGAGYASFSLIAALRPSVIKIDREIVFGIARDDAKQALVEAFVSFSRRIGARLLAEGIERRADLACLMTLGVDYGQGFLLGRPAPDPLPAKASGFVPRVTRSRRPAAPQAAGSTR